MKKSCNANFDCTKVERLFATEAKNLSMTDTFNQELKNHKYLESDNVKIVDHRLR